MRTKHLKRWLGFSLLAVFLIETAITLLVPAVQVHAQVRDIDDLDAPVWVDAATIRIGNVDLIDVEPGDGDMNFTTNGSQGGCISDLDFDGDPFENGNKAQAHLTYKARDPLTGECVTQEDDVTVGDTGNARIWFYWVDGGSIEPVFDDFNRERDHEFENLGGVWTEVGDTGLFGPDVSGCKRLTFEPGGTGIGTMTRRVDGGSEGDCHPQDNWQVRIGNVAAQSEAPGTGEPVGAGGNIDPEGGGDENDNSCENRGGVLGWILCPVINLMDGAINFLDTQIQTLLTVPESDLRDPQLQASWARMRNLALLILVPVMLVMVISTAMGFEFISAYTVKRAMPRFVIAALFIILSWTICSFLVILTNNVGAGIMGLMTSAVAPGGEAITLASLFDPGVAGAIFQSLILGTAVVGIGFVAISPGGIMLILLFALGVATSLFIGFLTLTLRQMLILALMLFSPLAILAWIFPGNDKLWKLWKDMFSKLLMMYPIIMILLASGRILAFVISESRTDTIDGIVGALMKVAAIAIPIGAIPTTYKAGGVVLAAFTGGVTNGLGGVRKSLKGREDRSKEQFHTSNLLRRQRMVKSLDTKAGKGGFIRRNTFGLASRGIGGHNLEAEISEQRAKTLKRLSDQSDVGDDTQRRASLTNAELVDISKKGAGALKNSKKFKEWDEATQTGHYKIGKDGSIKLKNVSGNFYNARDAQEGQRRWGKDHFAMQGNLAYEMGKGIKDEEVASIKENTSGLLESIGVSSKAQRDSIWMGAAYANQNSRLEYKHSGEQEEQFVDTDGKTKTRRAYRLKNGGTSFADEIYEKRGTYSMSQMGGTTIADMRSTFDNARNQEVQSSNAAAAAQAAGKTQEAAEHRAAVGQAQSTQAKIRESATTLHSRIQGGTMQPGDGDQGPVPVSGGSAGIGAPAHVEAELRDLNQYLNGGGGGGSGQGNGGGGGQGGNGGGNVIPINRGRGPGGGTPGAGSPPLQQVA